MNNMTPHEDLSWSYYQGQFELAGFGVAEIAVFELWLKRNRDIWEAFDRAAYDSAPPKIENVISKVQDQLRITLKPGVIRALSFKWNVKYEEEAFVWKAEPRLRKAA
jgi:hypothetical protein